MFTSFLPGFCFIAPEVVFDLFIYYLKIHLVNFCLFSIGTYHHQSVQKLKKFSHKRT